MTGTLGRLWLASRLSRVGRNELASHAVLFATAGLLAFLTLTTLAAPGVTGQRTDRAAALTPITDPSDERPAPGALLVFSPEATPTERWNGHPISRRYFAAGDRTAPRIPGTTATPGVGQYLASPALSLLIDDEPTAAALFTGLERVGTITADGLVDPHENRAIIGIPRTGPLLQAVIAFGDSSVGSHDDDRILNSSLTGLTGAMLWLPALALVAVTTRLRAGTRRARFRSLRNLGLSRGSARFVHAAECTVTALPGAAVGAMSFAAATRSTTRVPGTSFGFFATDAHLTWSLLVAGAVTTWLLLAVTAALSHGDDDSVIRRSRSARWVEAAGLTMVTASVGFLLALPVLERVIGTPAVFGMWIACAAAAVGLAVAGPAIVDRVCHPLSHRVRSAAALAGLRMGCTVTATTSRLGGLACVVIVLMLGCLSFTAILNGGSYRSWHDELARQVKIPVVVSDLADRVGFDDLQQLGVSDGLAQVAQIRSASPPDSDPDDGATTGIVFASCRDLSRLSGRPATGCVDGTFQWINRPGPGTDSTFRLTGGDPLTVPSASEITHLRGLPADLDGSIRADPGLAPAGVPSDDRGYFLVLADPGHLATSMAAISSLAPGVQQSLGDLDGSNPDFQQFPRQIEWLRAGSVASLLIAVLALLASLLGEGPLRSQRLRGLRLLGAKQATLIRAHLWSTALPLAVLGITAVAVGLIICLCLRSFDDRAEIPWAAAGAGAAGSVAVAFVLGLATVRSSLRQTRKAGAIEG